MRRHSGKIAVGGGKAGGGELDGSDKRVFAAVDGAANVVQRKRLKRWLRPSAPVRAIAKLWGVPCGNAVKGGRLPIRAHRWEIR